MGTIREDTILREYGGSPLSVAEALILGEIEPHLIQLVNCVVTPVILEAAKIRLEATGKLNSEHIKPAIPDEFFDPN